MKNKGTIMKTTLEQILQAVHDEAIIICDQKKLGEQINPKAETITQYLFDKYAKDFWLNIVVDIKGHNKGSYDNKKIEEIKLIPYECLSEKVKNMFVIPISYLVDTLLDKPLKKEDYESEIKFFFRSAKSSISSPQVFCSQCGSNSQLSLNDEGILSIKPINMKNYNNKGQEPCEFPEGVNSHSNLFNIHSGKLVIANDLRSLFPESLHEESDKFILTHTEGSINCAYGRKSNTSFWNDKGLIYLDTGNSSPHIFYNKKESKIAFKRDYWYDKKNNSDHKNFTANEKNLGYVCTDLWAICAMDYDYFCQLCQDNNLVIEDVIKEKNCTLVDIPVGCYEVTSFYETIMDGKTPYAEIIKIV